MRNPGKGGPQRFRKESYHGLGGWSSEPKWHRSASLSLTVGLCGYSLTEADVLLENYRLSLAVKPKGDLCSKCEKEATKKEGDSSE